MVGDGEGEDCGEVLVGDGEEEDGEEVMVGDDEVEDGKLAIELKQHTQPVPISYFEAAYLFI